MSHHPIVAIALVLCSAFPAVAEGRRFIGAWKALTYVIDGKEHSVDGLFIFTARYYSANIRFKLGDGLNDAANGNAGPYTADEKRIIFSQWVQVHVRPGHLTEPILSRKGPDAATEYYLEGDRLILIFPSGDRYVLRRLSEQPTPCGTVPDPP